MKKNLFRFVIASLIFAVSLTAFASCSNSSSSSVKGEVQEHGYFKVLVPEGYTLKHEDSFGDNKPDSFSINSNKNTFDYFYFNLYDLDSVKSSLEATKEINEGTEDVTIDVDGRTWKGIAYVSLNISCYQLYAEFDGNYVLVAGAGNEYKSDITQAVLSSLEVNVTK